MVTVSFLTEPPQCVAGLCLFSWSVLVLCMIVEYIFGRRGCSDCVDVSADSLHSLA